MENQNQDDQAEDEGESIENSASDRSSTKKRRKVDIQDPISDNEAMQDVKLKEKGRDSDVKKEEVRGLG